MKLSSKNNIHSHAHSPLKFWTHCQLTWENTTSCCRVSGGGCRGVSVCWGSWWRWRLRCHSNRRAKARWTNREKKQYNILQQQQRHVVPLSPPPSISSLPFPSSSLPSLFLLSSPPLALFLPSSTYSYYYYYHFLVRCCCWRETSSIPCATSCRKFLERFDPLYES